jgi:hypothetical protein
MDSQKLGRDAHPWTSPLCFDPQTRNMGQIPRCRVPPSVDTRIGIQVCRMGYLNQWNQRQDDRVVQELVLYCGCLSCGSFHVGMVDVVHLIDLVVQELVF